VSIRVSTPSRLCLFGEHLDYLSLEVITMAIDLRFYAQIEKRNDGKIVIEIKDSSIDTLNQKNEFNKYEKIIFSCIDNIRYKSKRDYFKSSVNVIKKRGYDISCGFNVKMDSEIPIGKGMCSSSTMIVAFIKAILEAIDADIKNSKKDIVELAYQAEVTEFNEPGGKMDHIASVYGGICHFDFKDIDNPKVEKLIGIPQGDFILVDSKERKDTINVLKNAKQPVLVALQDTPTIREMYEKNNYLEKIKNIDNKLRKPLLAAIDNYIILKKFLHDIKEENLSHNSFGEAIKKHHNNLRDGLNLSTKEIENIFNIAYNYGAIGGKINGSGGGGCCYIYTKSENSKQIIEQLTKAGYPTKIVLPAEGVKVEEN